MKLYVTKDNTDILKKYYLRKLDKQYEIINLISEMALHNCNNYNNDIIQKHILSYYIEKRFIKIHCNKKIKSLIYVVSTIDEDFILKLKSFFEDKKLYFTEINLINYNADIDANLYKYFGKII